jgi:hypothetical protein
MSTSPQTPEQENAGRFFFSVKSIFQFDNLEVHGVTQTLLQKTDEDNCFVGTYLRTRGNIESLLEISNSKHFQVVAMLARTLFELAVDIRLLDKIPNGPEKMVVAVEVEKLRTARKAVAFATANPSVQVDPIFNSYINLSSANIEAAHKRLWPNYKNLSKGVIKHWTGQNLDMRVRSLKAPFDRMYELDYPMLSWYVHSGLTGIVNIPAETFTLMCSRAFKVAADSYWEVLKVIIQRYKVEKANELIHQKMEVAKLLPFTDDPETEAALLRTIQN